MITSKASQEATLEFSKKHEGLNYKTLGRTGLTVSACGFGSYRVDFRVKEHSEALEYAIKSGINLIDTSANYSDGGSETLIGRVLEKLIKAGDLKREEIVIVTKGGYIQGKNYELASKLKEDGKGYKEVTEYTEKLWHCIHPDFLRDQITFSLERMKIETADSYLLHNPEYFLDSPVAKELNLEELRFEYYKRIKEAFRYLETEVDRGRIASYGISSNSFVYDTEDQTFTSFEQCLAAVAEVKAENNFKVIQFPLNLFEKGAVTSKNQLAETSTLISLAEDYQMGTLVNRPLNSISQKSLRRLADFEVKQEYMTIDETQIIAEINLLESMEDDFLAQHLETLQLPADIHEAVQSFMKAGQLLKENWKSLGSIESFNDVKKNFMIPRVNYAFSMIIKSEHITDEMKDSLDKIALQVNKIIAIIETLYGILANERSKDIHSALNEIMENDAAFVSLPLSEKALLMITSLRQISSVLVGMRQEKYVDDVIKCLKLPSIENAEELWQKQITP